MNNRSVRRLSKLNAALSVNRTVFLLCVHAIVATLLLGCACPKGGDIIGTSPPAPELLQPGDLIWPRPANAVVPVRAALHEGSTGDRKLWEQGKRDYLAALEKKSGLSSIERDRYNKLRRTSYEDFVKQYAGRMPDATSQTRDFPQISVGHVGIIQFENGQPVVIEAMSGSNVNKVQKVSYTEWIKHRLASGELFWLSRLKDTPPEVRAQVGAIAESYLDKPYNFWNFNLYDDSCFYCSKLAWLAITKATKSPPDGNPEGDRTFWYSPKMLLCSGRLESIVSSGNYAMPRKP
jgi:hypothetical protein